ncbi:MAG: rubredoxin [Bacteroidota bacterium]
MMRKDLQRILVKGGVLSPSELKRIIEMAASFGLESLHFGSRQDIVLPEAVDQQARESQFESIDLEYISERKYQNIVSSYVSANIFPSTRWLSGATYLYILERFSYNPKLQINITDPKQQLVPLFTGQLNFIASNEEDYWYLYLRLPNWDTMQRYPVLIYTWDVAKVAKTIESVYAEVETVSELFEEVNNEMDSNNRTISEPLNVPFNAFPYYEGMNKMGIDKYWLGLYWRNNLYDVKFLKAMCDLCLSCRIGKICLTPWKSLIVKGIGKEYKLAWEKLLGRFGINVRHSSLELNWHLPLADDAALDLKRFIVRNFDQNDISTYGLTFAIKSDYSVNFTSIVIEPNPVPTIVKNFQIRPTYNVLYCKNFNPNQLDYITYAQDVDRIELPGLLMELSQLYFEQLGEHEEETTKLGAETNAKENLAVSMHQCPSCLWVYDERFGDAHNDIPKGLVFEKLPVDYCCPVCETPKGAFLKVDRPAVLKNS